MTASSQTAVLIHGLCEERSVWSRQETFLAHSMNVMSYDVRGFGASPVGAGNGTVGQMADDLAQILSAHSAVPAWLVGFSMGGVIAQRFALDFPEMVHWLILIASSCTVGRSGVAFFNNRKAHRTPAVLSGKDLRDKIGFYFVFVAGGNADKLSGDLIAVESD